MDRSFAEQVALKLMSNNGGEISFAKRTIRENPFSAELVDAMLSYVSLSRERKAVEDGSRAYNSLRFCLSRADLETRISYLSHRVPLVRAAAAKLIVAMKPKELSEATRANLCEHARRELMVTEVFVDQHITEAFCSLLTRYGVAADAEWLSKLTPTPGLRIFKIRKTLKILNQRLSSIPRTRAQQVERHLELLHEKVKDLTPHDLLMLAIEKSDKGRAAAARLLQHGGEEIPRLAQERASRFTEPELEALTSNLESAGALEVAAKIAGLLVLGMGLLPHRYLLRLLAHDDSRNAREYLSRAASSGHAKTRARLAEVLLEVPCSLSPALLPQLKTDSSIVVRRSAQADA